jgi:hypothetical protein
MRASVVVVLPRSPSALAPAGVVCAHARFARRSSHRLRHGGHSERARGGVGVHVATRRFRDRFRRGWGAVGHQTTLGSWERNTD